jgi:hypothetical protein
MKITLDLSVFYSMGDERRFFQGLTENPAVSKVRGIGRQLEVTLILARLNRDALRELVALLWRYGISLESLSVLTEREKFRWLDDERCFWHKNMFPGR